MSLRLNPRILLSLATIVAAAAVIAGAAFAFFSDTETSTGNLFAAGEIDLQIDNTSYVTGPDGLLIASPATSWGLSDLSNQVFFNFNDVKPGDIGEDTISIHVNNNDAWVCAAARVTEDSDFSYTEPELEDDLTVNEGDPEGTPGELGENLNFAFWADDGDNVLEEGEEESIFLEGPISGLGEAGQIALSDSTGSVWENVATPVTGGQTVYVGKAWCFGTLTPDPVTAGEGTPVARGTGFSCDGAPEANNAAQTDRVIGDIQFYAVQSRNNPDFSCAEDYTPDWPEDEDQEEVGAVLSAYATPACDDTVLENESIQAAIDAASAGQTVCVEDGTHDDDTYPLRVNKDNLTLAAVNWPLASAELNGGVVIDNDGVTVTGFIINSSTLFSETFGVYVNTGVDNAVVSYNDLNGPGVGSGRGVVNALGTTTNLLVNNNVISNWLTGVFLNDSTGMEVSYNTLTGNGVGSANDHPVNNNIHHNIIKDNSIEGVGALLAGAEELHVNFNNIYDNGTGDDLNSYGATEVDAENNWWGDLDPSDNTDGPVDFDPFENAPFTEL